MAIVILAAAVVIQLGLQIRDRVSRPTPPTVRPGAAAAREYRPSERGPVIAGLDYASADRTLLLFVRSTCRYCTASMPFYSKLETARREAGSSVRLVAISPEPVEVLSKYLRDHKVMVDSMLTLSTVEAAQVKVGGTPTLVLTDRGGVVRQVWVGQLPPDKEREVISAFAGQVTPGEGGKPVTDGLP
jgi:hypothetical protein